MAERTLFLVAYDISSPKRLRRALAATRAYATGGQKSVHECYLTDAERRELRSKLAKAIDHRSDSVIMLSLDPRQAVRTLGIARPPRDPQFFYVG